MVRVLFSMSPYAVIVTESVVLAMGCETCMFWCVLVTECCRVCAVCWFVLFLCLVASGVPALIDFHVGVG